MFNNKITAERTTVGLAFSHFSIRKESKTFYGVYNEFNELVTSGTSLHSASKKAKLLEIGYQAARRRPSMLYID